jgi:hypothetical protein
VNATTERIIMHEQAGFTLLRAKKHPIWLCPCGHALLVNTGTRGGGSGATNARLRIARTLKVCEQRMRECA